jgi:hypothetical protein
MWRALVVALSLLFITQASLGQECRVTTTVRLVDEHGSPVLNIAPEQLKAEIGGSPAKVVAFAAGTKPVTILLIDISSSVSETWGQSVAAAKQLAGSAGDRVAAVVFRDRILDHASGREATDKLLDRLSTVKTSMGGTALYDSLIEVAGAAKNPDAALIVISDGHDNASRNSSDHVVDQFLKNRWPPVFGLVLDYVHKEARPGFKKIIAETGGLAAYPSSATKVAEAASELSAEVNAPFMVTLQASHPVLKPEKLKLEVMGPDGKPRHGIQISHVAEITACDETPLPPTKPE